jgi:hypothetical protein
MPSGFSPNNVWGSATPAGAEEELTTPTGQTCRARKITIEALLELGILTDADSLTPIVEKYTKAVSKTGPSGPKEVVVDENAILADPTALKQIIMLCDKAIPHIVVSPEVRLHFTERTIGKTKVTKSIATEDRESGVIYTDQISLDDKMYLFDWGVGGVKSMMSFRGGSSDDVGSVVPVTKPRKSPKRTPGTR